MVKLIVSIALQIFNQSVMGSFEDPAVEAKMLEGKKGETEKNIEVTLFEAKNGSTIPLRLLFVYQPSQGFAPIHEIMDGRNERIKGLYQHFTSKTRNLF